MVSTLVLDCISLIRNGTGNDNVKVVYIYILVYRCVNSAVDDCHVRPWTAERDVYIPSSGRK